MVNEEQIKALAEIADLNARAMTAHCECLGLNAENAISVNLAISPPYGQRAYQEVLQKYGLLNQKGEVII